MRKIIAALILLIMLIGAITGCSTHKQLSEDAAKIEALYSEALEIVDNSDMDPASRAALQGVRHRAEVLWAVLKQKYSDSENPWIQILGLLATQAISGGMEE